MLILREGPASLPQHLRLLCWATQAVGGAVLALALLARQCQGCARLRPYLLVAARLLFDVLSPQVVWQVASSGSRGGKLGEDEAAGWAGAHWWHADDANRVCRAGPAEVLARAGPAP